MRIMGFAGSLRKDSYNRALLRAAAELLPAEAELEVFDLEGIPMYNADLETPLPERVAEFKRRIRSADALLIVTPEYNYSFTGVLKNALDWGSRPSGDNSFAGKPAAIMGASDGRFGTTRAQYHLRQVLVSLNMHPMSKPEVLVATAQDKIDDQGKLVDNRTRDHIKRLLEALVNWTTRLGKPSP